MQEIDNVSIEKLNLSRRTFHALVRSGILTIGDLRQFLKKRYQIRNIGQKSFDEISKALYELPNSPSLLEDVKEEPVQLSFQEVPTQNKTIQAPIDVLDLLPSIKGKLKKYGFKTIDDLKRVPDSVLLNINFIGPKRLMEIKQLIDGFADDTKTVISEKSAEDVKKIDFCWAEIIQSYLEREKDNYIYVLMSRFGFKPKKLEEIATELSVTRERVRQIQDNAAGRFLKYLKNSHNSYSSSIIFLGKVEEIFHLHGDNLSLNKFRELLVRNNLLGDFSETFLSEKVNKNDLLELLICWLNLLANKRYNLRPLVFPIDIHDLIDSKNIAIKDRRALLNAGTKERKKIKRKVLFTGGIAIKEATRILSKDERIAVLLLKSMNLQKIDVEWFTFKILTDDQDKGKIPLRIAGLKMLAVNPVMKLDSFHDGLRRYASRFYSGIAPAHVVEHILPLLGFDIKNYEVSTQLSTKGILSKSEQCLISAINKNNGVASFLEIAEEFFLHNLSLPAVSVTLKRSPIAERTNEGFHKLRGTNISWQQIEDVQKRQKRFAQDEEVTHGLDGVVRMKFTVNSYAFLTGVVGAYSVKEMAGSWSLVYKDKSYGEVKIDESYLWSLAKLFKELGVKMGDRMELSFNTWNRNVSIERIENGSS